MAYITLLNTFICAGLSAKDGEVPLVVSDNEVLLIVVLRNCRMHDRSWLCRVEQKSEVKRFLNFYNELYAAELSRLSYVFVVFMLKVFLTSRSVRSLLLEVLEELRF